MTDCTGTHPGTAVFVVDDDRFLLVKRSKPGPGDGQWSLPGGKVECKETWQHCGRREILEETGLDVFRPRLLAVTTAIGEQFGWLTIWMAARYEGGLVQLNDEASEFDWVKCSELSLYDLWKPHWTPLLDETGGTRGLEIRLRELVPWLIK